MSEALPASAALSGTTYLATLAWANAFLMLRSQLSIPLEGSVSNARLPAQHALVSQTPAQAALPLEVFNSTTKTNAWTPAQLTKLFSRAQTASTAPQTATLALACLQSALHATVPSSWTHLIRFARILALQASQSWPVTSVCLVTHHAKHVHRQTQTTAWHVNMAWTFMKQDTNA
jgi:hypothetical protein